MEAVTQKTGGPVETVDFSIKNLIEVCLSKWIWFVVSLIVCVGLGVLYILSQQPVYQRYEQVLIKDQESGPDIGGVAEMFSSFGFGSSNAGVNNELISLTSPAIMQEVVERLKLDINYSKKGMFYNPTLYGTNLPFLVEFLDVAEQGGAKMRVTMKPDGSMTADKFRLSTLDGEKKFDGEVAFKDLDTEIKTPIGTVKFSKNPEYTGGPLEETEVVEISKIPLQFTVELYGKKLVGDLVDPDAEVIELSIKDVSVQRAVDVLNMVLTVYKENYIEDKNRLAVATSAFIDDRLKVIQEELGDVDEYIAKYQTSTGTADLVASATLALEKGAELENEITKLDNQISISEFMREYLIDPANKDKILPYNLGMESEGIEKQISEYNTTLLRRNDLVENSTIENPVVASYDKSLQGMKDALVKSLSAHVRQLQSSLKSMRNELSKTTSSMLSTPDKALPLLTEGRQQKVKESLYLFLLQKREENELGQKFTADNIRVITPPVGSLKPVSPRKMLTLCFSLLLGFGLPLSILYIKESSNTKIRDKKDLEGVAVPFAGEIPQVGKRGSLKTNANKKHKGKHEEKAPMAVVQEGKRDVVNEAFRVIRSNLDFMTGKKQGAKVIMLTSFNPGSGKSFISYNLALSFALRNKRVLLIDCDLRHGSSSMYVGMPKTGITDYLTENNDSWRSVLKSVPANMNLTILPIGKIPPNPAELLDTARLSTLIEEAKSEYDYIFLDCPPVNIVVDTQIIAPYADLTLFIVRAGLLERSALKEINEFYTDKKFKHIALILNGTDTAHSRYYTYGNYQSFAD